MTRRELAATAEDVESQSRDSEVSNGFFEPSSTLPTYEDAVSGTPGSRSEDSKDGDGKMVSQREGSPAAVRDTSFLQPRNSCTFCPADCDVHQPDKEQPLLTGGREHDDHSTKEEGQTKSFLKRYFWIVVVVVLWNIVARSFYLFPTGGVGACRVPSEVIASST